MFWKCIEYTIHWHKKKSLKKSLSIKETVQKIPSFFFRKLQLITVLLFNLRFLYELKHKVGLSKTVCRIFHFQFRFVFIKVYVFLTKCMDSLTLKRHNFFKNWNNRKATHSFVPRPLIFKLQQEVLKFNDIIMSRSFENVSVSNF